jgi:hypothetical protein
MRDMRDMVQLVHRDDIQLLNKLLTTGVAVIVGLIVVLWY